MAKANSTVAPDAIQNQLKDYRLEFECLQIDADEIAKVLAAAIKLSAKDQVLSDLLTHAKTMVELLSNRADCSREAVDDFLGQKTHGRIANRVQ